MTLLQLSTLLFIASSESPSTTDELDQLCDEASVKILVRRNFITQFKDNYALTPTGASLVRQINQVTKKYT